MIPTRQEFEQLEHKCPITNAYKANSYPDYYIIDRNGVLRWADIVNRDVEKAIKYLLAEKPATSFK